MAQMMVDMEQKMAQKIVHMEQKMAQMEERNAQMEEKMSISIQINERLAQIVHEQGVNIQTLSKLLIIKEETIVKEVKDKCRICEQNEVNNNQSVCLDCWRYCEPVKQPGLEAIEQEITSLRTEDEERFWRFHDKFIEQLGEYSQDTMHLFNSNEKEIRKLAEKHEKSVEDIRYCIDKMNYLKSSLAHMDDKVIRIMDVVQHLTEIISGREVAETKFAFMKFNYIEPAKGGRLTLDDLV